ncbi:MAG: YcgL domain-containing protein [Psychromonas sp.]|nr:YcgL domain-containing protein [Psychromonas sp.]
MLCAIYKSFLKNNTYLFVKKCDNFSYVPELLLAQLGKTKLVTIINLHKDKKMAIVSAKKIIQEIEVHGFYLQLPPFTINYLEEHQKMKQSASNKVRS